MYLRPTNIFFKSVFRSIRVFIFISKLVDAETLVSRERVLETSRAPLSVCCETFVVENVNAAFGIFSGSIPCDLKKKKKGVLPHKNILRR